MAFIFPFQLLFVFCNISVLSPSPITSVYYNNNCSYMLYVSYVHTVLVDFSKVIEHFIIHCCNGKWKILQKLFTQITVQCQNVCAMKSEFSEYANGQIETMTTQSHISIGSLNDIQFCNNNIILISHSIANDGQTNPLHTNAQLFQCYFNSD